MSAFTKTKSIPKAQLGMKLDSIINDKSRYLCLNFQVRTMLYNIGLSVLFSCYEPIPNRHVHTYLVQLMEQPILRIPNFNFPNLQGQPSGIDTK